jgi:hypothetical protein
VTSTLIDGRHVVDFKICQTARPPRQRHAKIVKVIARRDRVVQGALKLILEAIFEADFCPNSYGFRPKRSPHRALAVVRAGSCSLLRVSSSDTGISSM